MKKLNGAFIICLALNASVGNSSENPVVAEGQETLTTTQATTQIKYQPEEVSLNPPNVVYVAASTQKNGADNQSTEEQSGSAYKKPLALKVFIAVARTAYYIQIVNPIYWLYRGIDAMAEQVGVPGRIVPKNDLIQNPRPIWED